MDPESWPRLPVTELAAKVLARPPSLGEVRLVGVDGHAGSGKSTLAGLLAAELGGMPVVRLDDLASHDCLFGWTQRLRRQVLEPLARGELARYGVYDWVRGEFTEQAEAAPAPVVVVEGVGAGRRALRPCLAWLVWLEVPQETAWARGEARDGPGQSAFWGGWKEAERGHFDADPTRPAADILLAPRSDGYAAQER